MKKLPKAVIEHFEEKVINDNQCPDDAFSDADGNVPDCLKNFKIAHEDHVSGGENDGSDYKVVYKLTDKKTKDNHYLLFSGYYVSYDGTSWDNGSVVEVKKSKKTVVDWKKA